MSYKWSHFFGTGEIQTVLNYKIMSFEKCEQRQQLKWIVDEEKIMTFKMSMFRNISNKGLGRMPR